jgi:Zn-dependent M16 (insulinase) family peptidase
MVIGFTGSEADYTKLDLKVAEWDFKQLDLTLSCGSQLTPTAANEVWIGSTTIGYVTQNFSGVTLEHLDLPALQVMASIVGGQFLHKYIREEGGAYGGNATVSSAMQQISFYTVRDPNIARSIEIFQKAIKWLADGSFTDKDVDNAICKIIGSIDTPQSPKARGSSTALNTMVGIDEDLIDLQRSRILQVTKADVIKVAQDYLNDKKLITTVVTGIEQYNQEQGKLGQFELVNIA